MRYSILDPTGNITALVESHVDVDTQPVVATDIMHKHPEVEQVGFVRFTPDERIQAHLRMAGGEFCGNATMCTASLYAIRHNVDTHRLFVSVSGATQPVLVELQQRDDSFDTSIRMPNALSIEHEALEGSLPLVRMHGISHVVVEESSPFYALLSNAKKAEDSVRAWCRQVEADGLGVMFLDSHRNLTPLVYVPGSNTMFWENSCASGSAAIGMYLAERADSPIDVTLHEPGGNLRVESDPRDETTVLHGQVRLVV